MQEISISFTAPEIEQIRLELALVGLKPEFREMLRNNLPYDEDLAVTVRQKLTDALKPTASPGEDEIEHDERDKY